VNHCLKNFTILIFVGLFIIWKNNITYLNIFNIFKRLAQRNFSASNKTRTFTFSTSSSSRSIRIIRFSRSYNINTTTRSFSVWLCFNRIYFSISSNFLRSSWYCISMYFPSRRFDHNFSSIVICFIFSRTNLRRLLIFIISWNFHFLRFICCFYFCTHTHRSQ